MVEVVALKNRGISRMLNGHSRQKASGEKRKNKDKELRAKRKNNKRGSRKRRNKKTINKTSKRRRISVDNNPDHPATSSIVDDNVVLFHLLSRLPVKSLMRIKCVCKRWKLIIEQDPDFINLHLTHSEMRPGLFIILPKSAPWERGCSRDYESFISADFHFSGRVANVHTIKRTKLLYRKILGPITGLVCFVDNCAVRIQNISTMESTPWMKSTVCMNLEKDNVIVKLSEQPTCYFGFDPSTKQHKAIFVWCTGKFLNFPVCEVLTVGDNTWRIIDEVLPCHTVGNTTHYANGSIYWLVHCRSGDGIKSREAMCFSEDEGMEECSQWIMAFDIGSEKFRMIPAPKFTVEYYDGKEYECKFPRFSEVDGCLAVICQEQRICKMWTFHDHNKENGASTISNEKDWTLVTITLPSSRVEDWSMVYFHPVAGTDQIVLETYRDPGQYSSFMRNAKLAKFYFYDRKQKTVKKFEVNDISFFPECIRTDCVTTFIESLLPVQKKLEPRESLFACSEEAYRS